MIIRSLIMVLIGLIFGLYMHDGWCTKGCKGAQGNMHSHKKNYQSEQYITRKNFVLKRLHFRKGNRGLTSIQYIEIIIVHFSWICQRFATSTKDEESLSNKRRAMALSCLWSITPNTRRYPCIRGYTCTNNISSKYQVTAYHINAFILYIIGKKMSVSWKTGSKTNMTFPLTQMQHNFVALFSLVHHDSLAF